MNVRCSSCQTVYRVDPAKVPAGGVRSRCAVCGTAIAVSPHGGAPVAAPVAAPVTPGVAPPIAPTATPEPVATPAAPSAPAAPAHTPRLSQPFYQPRIALSPEAEAPVAVPERPSAPVFRPTPGQPVTASPQPAEEAAPDEITAVVPATVIPEVPAAPPPAAPAPPAKPPEPAVAAPAPSPAEPTAPKKPVNPFLQRDPKQKARRLARALVSDMIVYQPDKRQQALAAGTLKDEFEEEINKSWEEYVEQVGEEMANSTDFWKEALNEILADGQSLF